MTHYAIKPNALVVGAVAIASIYLVLNTRNKLNSMANAVNSALDYIDANASAVESIVANSDNPVSSRTADAINSGASIVGAGKNTVVSDALGGGSGYDIGNGVTSILTRFDNYLKTDPLGLARRGATGGW